MFWTVFHENETDEEITVKQFSVFLFVNSSNFMAILFQLKVDSLYDEVRLLANSKISSRSNTYQFHKTNSSLYHCLLHLNPEEEWKLSSGDS
jgi:hypothetical protein